MPGASKTVSRTLLGCLLLCGNAVLGGAAGCRFRGSAASPSADVSAALQRGVMFLSVQQLPDGTFPIDECADAVLTQCEPQSSVGGAIIALYSLREVEGDAAARVRKRAAECLQRERGADGLWRYLPRTDPHYTKFPPDIDDTSIAALALALAGTAWPDQVERLLQQRNSDGLLPTWVPDRDPAAPPAVTALYTAPGPHSQQSVDCGVNANALAYVASQGQQPDSLCRSTLDLMQQEFAPDCSVFYGRAALTYIVGRAYAMGATCLTGGLAHMRWVLQETQHPDGSWGNALETALSVSALLSIAPRSEAVARAIPGLLAAQQADGGWPTAVYFRGGRFFYGSRAATTALVVEALAHYAGQPPPAHQQP